jgi:hypothetical protein
MLPLVIDAEKENICPAQSVVADVAEITTDGITKGVTVTEILFEIAVEGEEQVAFEVRTQVTASLLFKVEEKVEPVATLLPFTFHW